MRSLPRVAAAYLCAVMMASVVILAAAVSQQDVQWRAVVLVAVLYCAADAAPVKTNVRSLSISMAFPVGLAAVLILGPWQGSLVSAAGALTGPLSAAWYRRAFNGSQMVVSAFMCGYVYRLLPGTSSDFSHALFPQVLFPVAVAGLVFCVLNYLLVAFAISLVAGRRFGSVWWSGVAEMALPSLGYGLLGLVIAVLWTGGVGVLAGVLVLAPMMIARWAFQQYGEQHKAYEATVASLIRAVETKDYYTRGHSERVSKASVMLAKKLGMREDRLEMLRYAGMLHDVGKLGVPTKLLQKTGPLDDDEFATIKLHPTRGFEMVNGIEFLDEAMRGIRHHHERIDGLGYPDGLKGNDIPEFARMIAVADAFDSMTSTRSYRGARSVEAAIAELRHWSGTQFDTQMVDALIAAVDEHGWETSVEPAPEVIDPAVLVPRDHDDPASDIAAAVIPPQYGLPAEAY